VLLLIIAYQFAFKRTIESWHLHTELQKKLSKTSALTYQPGYLVRKNHNLNRIMRLYRADTTNLRSNVLGTITSIAEAADVTVAEVPLQDASSHTSSGASERIRFEGDYYALVKTLKKLQSTSDIGVVRSVSMKTIKDQPNTDKQGKLIMDIYLVISFNQ
jgi:hypothetical protein